jgi:hypothetical protein
MPRLLRLVPLLAALLLAAPTAPAHAADVPAGVDVSVPKPVREWLKRNALALYIVFDEMMDDVFGGCPPPSTPQPDPVPIDPPPVPW